MLVPVLHFRIDHKTVHQAGQYGVFFFVAVGVHAQPYIKFTDTLKIRVVTGVDGQIFPNPAVHIARFTGGVFFVA